METKKPTPGTVDLADLIYEMLELDPENNPDLDEFIPTIDEIQTEMSRAIPYDEKLSDLVVQMREELDELFIILFYSVYYVL